MIGPQVGRLNRQNIKIMYKIVTQVPLADNEKRVGGDAPCGSENKKKLIELEKIAKKIKRKRK